MVSNVFLDSAMYAIKIPCSLTYLLTVNGTILKDRHCLANAIALEHQLNAILLDSFLNTPRPQKNISVKMTTTAMVMYSFVASMEPRCR